MVNRTASAIYSSLATSTLWTSQKAFLVQRVIRNRSDTLVKSSEKLYYLVRTRQNIRYKIGILDSFIS